MSDYFVKKIFMNDDATLVSVDARVPGDGVRTGAIVSREGGVVTAHGVVTVTKEAFSFQQSAAALPSAGAVGNTAAQAAGKAGEDGVFVVLITETVSAAEIEFDMASRLDNPGPGDIPVGTTIHVTSGAKTASSSGAFPWTAMPPDEVFGEAIESVNIGKFRIVLTRETKAHPVGLGTNVTMSRDTYSQVDKPNWTLPATNGYWVGVLKANTLEGLSGDTDLEWTRLGTTYYDDVGSTVYEPGGSGTTVSYGSPLNLTSTCDWDINDQITVTAPA